MKKYSFLSVTAAFCVGVFISAIYAPRADADNLVRPALPSKLAANRLMLDVTCARDQDGGRQRDDACTINRLVAVGAFGHILLSDDRGETWRQARKVPVGITLTAVHFPSKNIGYAVGQDNVILKTSDGGETWIRVHIDPDIVDPANRMRAFSEEPRDCGGSSERDNCLIPLFAVHFRDDNHGLAVGAFGQALSTEDGGKNWTWRPLPQALVKNEFEDPADPNDDYEKLQAHLNGITQTSNGDIYVAAEYGSVYRSTDGGKSFRALQTGYNGSFWGVLGLGSSVLAYGMRGNIWRSDNLGRTWRKLDTGNAKQSFQNGIRLTNDNAIVLTGLNGVIAISRDNGRSFKAFIRKERKGYAALAEGANGSIILFGEDGIKHVQLDSLSRR